MFCSQITLAPTWAPSYFPTESPSAVTSDYVVMNAKLSFNLPLHEPMTNASLITTFENTIQSFLGEKLNESNGLVVKAYDVTVVAQTLKDPSTENRVLQSTSGSSYLFVDTSLTAKGSPPALAARFPFQAYVHDVATKNDDELFKAIYASVLKHLEETNETESVGMSSINGSKIKNVAIGSTIAGAAVLVSAIFTLFIMHRRRVNDRLADNVVPPPAA